MQAAIIRHLPAYSDIRGSLARHRARRCIPVPDPLSIPAALRTTLRGREVAEDDINHNESFLLHTGQDGRLLVFCVGSELEVMHQSQVLICDGTFEMSPDTAYQVYTVHGYCTGEGMPLCWALLPNKTTSTYKEMFSSLRTALETLFGSIGSVKSFLVDFEQAAICAIQEVFPEVTVKGCTFHFRQAVMRHNRKDCGRHTSPRPNIQMSVCGCDASWQCQCCLSLLSHSAGMFCNTHHRREIPLWTPKHRRLRPTSAERGSPAPFRLGCGRISTM